MGAIGTIQVHIFSTSSSALNFWCDLGRGMSKWNTFEDLRAAAEQLSGCGWVAADKICVSGTSAGALAAAVCANAYPHLFRAMLLR
jgi:protease II